VFSGNHWDEQKMDSFSSKGIATENRFAGSGQEIRKISLVAHKGPEGRKGEPGERLSIGSADLQANFEPVYMLMVQSSLVGCVNGKVRGWSTDDEQSNLFQFSSF
jgi:hypothetical protein